MTFDEAIERYTSNAEYERTHGSLQGCMDFRQLAEWLKDYKRLLEQDPCEDEYIKVPKKALKYRTAGMVAYNAEWLKNHFDIERAVILGCEYKEQEPKTGYWIEHEIEGTLKWLECSNCHCETSYNVMQNYCPNCGAKMVEPQERSE